MAADLAHGGRRLRRRRAGAGLTALATLGVVGAAATVIPTVFPAGGPQDGPGPAAGAGTLSRTAVLAEHLGTDNVLAQLPREDTGRQPAPPGRQAPDERRRGRPGGRDPGRPGRRPLG